MTLFKRGRYWWTGFYVDGRRFQQSTGTGNRRQAETVEQKLKGEMNLRSFDIAVVDPAITVEAVAAQFIKHTSPGGFHVGRIRFLNVFFGTMPVRAVTRNTVAEYRQARRIEKPKLKDSSLNRDVGVLRRVLYWALEQGLITANPLARISMVRERRVKKPILSLAHEHLILATAKPHLRELVIAAVDTGMRRGELFKQVWEDVDLTHNVLFVTRSKTAEGDGREIPLTYRLKDLLQHKAKGLDSVSGSVFTYQGNPIGDFKRSWKTAQRDAKLPLHYRFHDLRHTFATRLMEAGVVQDIRMALMGHEPRTVHWGYTHVDLAAKREAIKKLERWREKERKRKKQ
jgi:integrase